jgi:hypothetical protein
MLKENMVLIEKLFTLKQKSVPDSTRTGRVTVYSKGENLLLKTWISL